MIEEIHCITNEVKTAKNKWGNDGPALFSSLIQCI